MDVTAKPFSPSCDRNRTPILEVLKSIIPNRSLSLLEIGSGTGQHAVYFAPHFPSVQWVTSDVSSSHDGIIAWMTEAHLPNLYGPLEIEIGQNQILKNEYDVVFASNILHIISWQKCETLTQMLGNSLAPKSQVIFYGPFNYNGEFTSQSNSDFNTWLKARDDLSGIRDFEEICRLMNAQSFNLEADFEMPSNNRILHFRKND